ncbi:hypothetical protein GOP47_0023748 [Adiantum capillus-veneris]|uniref:Uncharacterized protein n=1 Tax=Adiantum capillus-veneris TaxID=13818 RepID=A0A9D4U4A6_ADICA|nr:hypothetical protein GOP47_0023748 [Adiantum capillus-veneris]
MTRPLGKSPARLRIRSSQLDLNQVSLIDVRAEDDDLLPGKGIASPQGSYGPSQCPRPGASPFKASAIRPLACIQEDPPEYEGSQGIDESEAQDVLQPLSKEELVVKKKKKKSGFNLRKSLAWNNAFFTEEGVLDPEELSLVNRTFKKPLEEPKPPSNKKSPFASKILNTSAISKINFSPVRFQKSSSHGETRHKSTASAQGSPLGSIGNAFRRTDQQNNGVKGSAMSKHTTGPASLRARDDTVKLAKSMLPTRGDSQGLKLAPLKRQTEENTRISSGPGLPARSNIKPPLIQPKQSSSISSTLSSASRMMKDRLGMVFAGRSAGNPKLGTKPPAEDDTVVPSHRIPEYSDSAKLARCYSHSTYERFGRSMSSTSTELASPATSASTALQSKASNQQGAFASKVTPVSYSSFSSSLHKGKEQAPGAVSSHSQGVSGRSPQPNALQATISNTREREASETIPFSAKPSGLRMPSPKLGFFDKAKTSTAAHVAVLRERTNGFGYDGVASQSARYVGTGQLPNNVIKQSSSNSYGVVPQALKTASSQRTVGTDMNGPGRQNAMQRPPLPSKNSGQPLLEHDNGPHIVTTPHLQYTDNSFKQEPSSMLAKGSQSGPCATRNVPSSSSCASSDLPHLQYTENSYKPEPSSMFTKGSQSGPCATGNVPSSSSCALSDLPHLQCTENTFKPEPSSSVKGSQSGPCATGNVPTSSFCASSDLPHLQHTENSFKPEASSMLAKGSQSGPCAIGNVPSSSSCASSNLASCSLPTSHDLTSFSSQISGSHNSDTGTILQVKKNVQNVLPAVKKMVNKLNLSPLQIIQQENLPLEHPQITEASQYSSPGKVKAYSKGDIGGACTNQLQEEWPQVKSGAVQHSPPQKEPPKYGPWSPVRRNAPELGPFDCTKYTNNTAVLH